MGCGEDGMMGGVGNGLQDFQPPSMWTQCFANHCRSNIFILDSSTKILPAERYCTNRKFKFNVRYLLPLFSLIFWNMLTSVFNHSSLFVKIK